MMRRLKYLINVLGIEAIVGICLTLLPILGALVSVRLDQGILLGFFLAVSLFGEIPLAGSEEGTKLLRRASLGYTTRIVMRLGIGLLWVVQTGSSAAFGVGLILCVFATLIRSGDAIASAALRRQISGAVQVKNLDVPGMVTSSPLVGGPEHWRALPLEVLVLIGLVGVKWSALFLYVATAGMLVGLALLLLVVRAAYIVGTPRKDSAVDPKFQRALDQLAPRVVLYFSGNADSVYQVNMWLSTMEKVDSSVLVLLREQSVFEALAVTNAPVMCVPDATDLMNLNFDSVRVALYPVNVGKNIHFLRLSHIKSVFVGHGDSDKSASFNPYSRVYDEIWVAGPAGRTRYERALIGVRDEDIKEVSRPQVADLAKVHGAEPTNTVRTLLYAPTWEGWNEEQNYCSITKVGLPLVKRILAEGLPIRVLYRPHPFTGTRAGSVARASNQMKALLESANAKHGIANVAPSAVGSSTDAVTAERALAARDAAFLNETMAGGHVVLPAEWGTAMASCMTAADGMLTDVSSVLSDFLVTDKPYACANPSSASENEFTAAFPATSGGFVLTSEAKTANDFLSVIVGETPDTHAERRAVLREDLLGPHPEDAHETFNLAITELANSADERLAFLERQGR